MDIITPPEVKFGVERPGLRQFDDYLELSKHQGPYKISAIRVQWNHEHILGVQFHYLDAKGNHHEGHDETKFKPFGTLFGKVHEETFHIDANDELYEISGFAGLKINKLHFRTYRGKHQAFGHDNGAPFKFAWKGHTFGAASGGYGENLDFLVLRTHHLHHHKEELEALV